MKKFSLHWCCLVIFLLLAMLANPSPKAHGQSTIKIGALIDLTGPIGPGGIDMEKGIRLAVERVGTIAGKKIELIVEDVASDAGVSMDKAKKLVETNKVHLIIGPINGGGGLAVAGYAERVRLPQFAPMPAVNDAALHDWAFCPGGLNMQAGYGVGVYAYDVLGYRTAVGLAADFVPGHDYTTSFKLGFEERGGKVIQEVYYPFGSTNMIPYFTSLKQADVIAFWGTPGECFAAFPQYKELNMKMPLVQAEDGGVTASPNMLKNLGKAAIGTVFGTSYLYNADIPGNKEFVEAYQQKYDQLPSVMSGAVYADMQLIFAALTANRGETTPDSLYKAIKGVSVDTVRGHLSFPPDQGGFGLVTNYPALMGKIGPNMEIQPLVPFRDVLVTYKNGQYVPSLAK